jgi:hypothetical protein
MIDSGFCRSEINKRVRHILRAFKWAVADEMVPASVHHGLQAVSGLRVRENEPVRPVPDAFVDAIGFGSQRPWPIGCGTITRLLPSRTGPGHS